MKIIDKPTSSLIKFMKPADFMIKNTNISPPYSAAYLTC